MAFQNLQEVDLIIYQNDGFHWQNSHLKIVYKLSYLILIDFSLTVKAATLIFISGRGSPISSANEGKSGFIYNLIKS